MSVLETTKQLLDFQKGLILIARHLGKTFDDISDVIQKPKTNIRDFFRRYEETNDYRHSEDSGRK
jgi:hypothetical protein